MQQARTNENKPWKNCTRYQPLMNSSTASAEVKREGILAFFLSCSLLITLVCSLLVGALSLIIIVFGLSAAERSETCRLSDEVGTPLPLSTSGRSTRDTLHGGRSGVSGGVGTARGLGAPNAYGRTGKRESLSKPSCGVL